MNPSRTTVLRAPSLPVPLLPLLWQREHGTCGARRCCLLSTTQVRPQGCGAWPCLAGAAPGEEAHFIPFSSRKYNMHTLHVP
jgi:hypothetical protein